MARCFVALTLDEASLRAVHAAQRKLLVPGLRETHAEDFHVTLVFLGDVDEETVAKPVFEAARLGLVTLPKLGQARVSGFPSAERAHVAVLILDDVDGAVGAIAERAIAEARRLGVHVEDRPFKAHVTLGRSKQAIDLRPHAREVELGEGTDIVLFRSERQPDGRHYVPVHYPDQAT
ncbi:MAG TPA: RNA 2',3'-cyclic phosphodiesterase [Polyangiaceae bacterium]